MCMILVLVSLPRLVTYFLLLVFDRVYERKSNGLMRLYIVYRVMCIDVLNSRLSMMKR